MTPEELATMRRLTALLGGWAAQMQEFTREMNALTTRIRPTVDALVKVRGR
jgi:hypothetical protein